MQETDLTRLGDDIERRVQEIEQRDATLAESDLPARLELLKQSVSLVIFDFVRTGAVECRLTLSLLYGNVMVLRVPPFFRAV